MIQEEKRARQQLEVYIVQFHQEFKAKISSFNTNHDENRTCVDCLNRIQDMEIVMNSMKQKFGDELQAITQSLLDF